MQHLAPHLVTPPESWGDGRSNAWRLAALRERIAWGAARLDEGDNRHRRRRPALRTPAKGKAYFDLISRRIADYFVELAQANVDDLYERPV